jgi:hypothetical protein
MDPGTGTRLHTAKPGPVFANNLCLDIPDLLVIGIRPGCSSLSTVHCTKMVVIQQGRVFALGTAASREIGQSGFVALYAGHTLRHMACATP